MESILNQQNIYSIFRLPKTLKMIPEDLKKKEEGEVIIKELNRRILARAKYTIENKYFYLLTNLLDTSKYSIEHIKNIYHKRWEIEEYFKFSKTYLKLDHIKQTNEIDIHKNIEYELFISKFVYYLYNLFSFKEKKNRIVNKSLIVDAIFNTDFLLNIIYNKDIDKAVEIFEKYFIKLTHTQKGKSYEIKCINPVYKSYRKYNKNVEPTNINTEIT